MWPLYVSIVLGLAFGIMSAYVPGSMEKVILFAAGIVSISWAGYELFRLCMRRRKKGDGR